MNNPISIAKAALRERMLATLKAVPKAHRTVESAQLCARLPAAAVWQTAQFVLSFAPYADEPDIWPLLVEALAAGKRIALPSYDAATGEYGARQIRDAHADTVAGRYGIREPAAHCPVVPLNQLDLVLVPGVAFDWNGHRLGRGKGYYDRLLQSVHGATCGVAFDEQLVDAIPVEPHDIRLSYILTPTRWQTASPRPVLK